ncbi:MAG: DM13 domain-containing protein [Pelatocladus maniniholoensis HA4357-MV3]|uniref:DM13 domain-containing protein n=1 Tax=Pelatocladus maniniholoensis HA4357-MV3 TaxID=1117104 RepID=A0A9E3LTR4_9NOST|nr:DM13 domain-containing protein [Pelatocladus maniniholoensis HA4357-MV3]
MNLKLRQVCIGLSDWRSRVIWRCRRFAASVGSVPQF